ncbi:MULTISPECIES: hypothetical protein [unclassified Janthinobacterium]|uniref:hypothetical protein n=1 Tax=unclassified Janthinobacterium TaxID=2610881 RepID=UPI001E2A7D28|nr:MULTISPECIES: hypothetical protein [unclassified Janthinobacterium]MCC7646337.1 hypothetical protein [Janthinobacterium sp. EB271-G4-3-1]MCC7694810.1 hypothetical protein [Janthinobacterium sp. EB271-G4-3-2]
MQLNRNVAVLCLAACASQPAAATAAPVTYHRQTATQSAPEVRTRDLLLFGAGLILLAGRRRPEHDTWQVRGQD